MKGQAIVGLIALGALGCHGDRTYPQGPSAEILDAYHNNGSVFFSWLAPMLNQQPPPEQVFSKQLTPTITISNLCTGSVIRTFSGSEVETGNGQYQANWHTADDDLDSTCTYRITVQAGARQLGMADVDVVDNGSELKYVDTDNYIPLLADRTLPIRFYVGVGSQCERVDSDCGEGTVQPGQSTTIVTTHGQAGVFVPAGAVDQPVTLIIESTDERPCLPGLPEPVFPGDVGAVGNSCYDFHTEPPLTEVNATGKFNTPVTVGICPVIGDLDHATSDLLQIFQLHPGVPIFALNNVPAPFLHCDPGYTLLGSRGSSPPPASHRSLLGALAAGLRSLVTPRPLLASTRVAIDLGAGGSTDMFSRFTWALPNALDLNFDQTPELAAILPGATVNSAYSRLGVTFSRSNPLSLCPGTAVYANDAGLLGLHSGQNNISVCPLGVASDFSQNAYGTIKASFVIPAGEACINATPTGFHNLLPGGVAFLEALGANGAVLNRMESTTQRTSQRLCVAGQGITAVRFAGKGSAYAIFDNLTWTPALSLSQ